jgi:uncharacterized protein (TIGR02001 family)
MNVPAAHGPLRPNWRPPPRRSRLIFLALECCLAQLALRPSLAAAQLSVPALSGHVAILSDYRFRGESLSGGRGALQGGINSDLGPVYFGALVSQALHGHAGLVSQTYAGYAQAAGSQLTLDVGAVRYDFTGSSEATNYDYTDFFAGASSDLFSIRLYTSRRYFGIAVPSYYAEASITRPFASVQWFAKLGYLHRSNSHASILFNAAASAVDFSVGGSTALPAFRGTRIEITLSGTNLRNGQCVGYSGRCRPALVAAAIRSF